MVRVIKAGLPHLEKVAPLFDSYRKFNEKQPDLEKAKAFIKARLERDESVVYLALGDNEEALGFAQLYPTFCSVDAMPALILYDLFVAREARRMGVASKLMDAVHKLAEDTGATWLKLETESTNFPAQTLYEKRGWERDNDFYTYFLRFKK